MYRDVKPNNFVLGGREGSEILYVVDFGLARMYVDEHNRHLPFEQQNFAGTAHYASLNAHLKRAQSRRDDLESLGFLLIYFLEGSLPWHGLKAASKRERRKVSWHCVFPFSLSFLASCLTFSFLAHWNDEAQDDHQGALQGSSRGV